MQNAQGRRHRILAEALLSHASWWRLIEADARERDGHDTGHGARIPDRYGDGHQKKRELQFLDCLGLPEERKPECDSNGDDGQPVLQYHGCLPHTVALRYPLPASDRRRWAECAATRSLLALIGKVDGPRGSRAAFSMTSGVGDAHVEVEFAQELASRWRSGARRRRARVGAGHRGQSPFTAKAFTARSREVRN